MSIWTRADDDVKLARTTWRLVKDDARRQRIRDERPVTRAELIADFRRGSATAASIIGDIRDCNANRHSDPLRWAIDLMREGDKLSMLAAQIGDLRRLLHDLGGDADGGAMS